MPSTHVLVIEDDHVVARLYNKVMRSQGLRTLLVNRVEAALAEFYRFTPDVIWLDWRIGEGTSAPILDLLNTIPELHRPHVVLVTGKVETEALQPYRHLISGVLVKPVNIKSAIQFVDELALAQAATRTPYGSYSIEPLHRPDLLMVTVRGFVGVETMQAIAERLTDARGVVCDMRELAYHRLDFRFGAWDEMPPLRVQTALLVHSPEGEGPAQVLASTRCPQAEQHFFHDLNAALQFARQLP